MSSQLVLDDTGAPGTCVAETSIASLIHHSDEGHSKIRTSVCPSEPDVAAFFKISSALHVDDRFSRRSRYDSSSRVRASLASSSVCAPGSRIGLPNTRLQDRLVSPVRTPLPMILDSVPTAHQFHSSLLAITPRLGTFDRFYGIVYSFQSLRI